MKRKQEGGGAQILVREELEGGPGRGYSTLHGGWRGLEPIAGSTEGGKRWRVPEEARRLLEGLYLPRGRAWLRRRGRGSHFLSIS